VEFGTQAACIVQNMAGAQYLPHLTSTAEVTVPPREPIPDHMKQQQRRASAAAFHLPSNVEPQAAKRECTGMCDVCQSDSETTSVRLLSCAKCGTMVHNTCYGTDCPPVGSVWLCEVCDAGIEQAPVCALCPVSGGAMRFTKCGRWVHCVCALWIPEVTIQAAQAPCIDQVAPHASYALIRTPHMQMPWSTCITVDFKASSAA
jgi:PHD-zinc-finger like domain/PHD-finger